MSVPRVFLPHLSSGAKKVILRQDSFHHLVHVLRLSPGDEFTVYGWDAEEARVVVQEVGKDYLTGEILSRSPLPRPSLQVIVLQALLKENSMNTVIQGLSMLGVHRLIPFYSRRSVPQPVPDRVENKMRRWGKIALRAASLSRLPSPMAIHAPVPFAEALQMVPEISCRCLLFEEKKYSGFVSFLQASPPASEVLLMAGPEGGFEKGEVETAQQNGWLPLWLRQRILASSFAGIIAVAILQACWGDLGK